MAGRDGRGARGRRPRRDRARPGLRQGAGRRGGGVHGLAGATRARAALPGGRRGAGRRDTPVSEVIELARHPDGCAASMALAALERRDDVPEDWVDAAIRSLPRPSHSEDAFQLRAIARHAPGRAIGRILGRTEGIYPEYVVDFVRARIEAGEPIDVEIVPRPRDGRTGRRPRAYLDRFGGDMGDEVRACVRGMARRSSSSARSAGSGSARSTDRRPSSRAAGARSSTSSSRR